MELVTYYGAANPPASYGGVGGTTRDKARCVLSTVLEGVRDGAALRQPLHD